MVRDWSKGKTVLNLFCYTGSFSVYAMAGGAAEVVSVDLSNTYLQWAERNMKANFTDTSNAQVYPGRCAAIPFKDRKGSFDLIVWIRPRSATASA
jgi:23S rRNA (cytosine1962-C5)-methyltransferase